MKRNNRAFTLIEMLVVVLIIAILAAVALPQYQKAVYKSQGAEALQALAIMDKVQHDYYLEHGTYLGMQEDGALPLDLPTLKYFQCTKQWQPDGTNYQTDYLNQLVPSNVSNSNISVTLTNNDVLLIASWSYGKRNTMTCRGKPDINKCKNYFNCTMQELPGIPPVTVCAFE